MPLMLIDIVSIIPVADDTVVHAVEDWLRSEGLTPCGDCECRQYGPHTVWTVQGFSATAVDKHDLSRSFEHYFHEYNLSAGAAATISPYMLEQYPCPAAGFIYTHLFSCDPVAVVPVNDKEAGFQSEQRRRPASCRNVLRQSSALQNGPNLVGPF